MKELISINLVITKLSMLLLGGGPTLGRRSRDVSRTGDAGRAPARMETRREGKLARRLLLRSLLSRQLGVTVSGPSAALLLGCWSWRGWRSGRVSRSDQGSCRCGHLLVLVMFVHLQTNTPTACSINFDLKFLALDGNYSEIYKPIVNSKISAEYNNEFSIIPFLMNLLLFI